VAEQVSFATAGRRASRWHRRRGWYLWFYLYWPMEFRNARKRHASRSGRWLACECERTGV